MLSSIFFLIIGSIGLFYGSEWLVDGAKDIAKKFKISDLVIGLTIVSIGTSFPELVVGIISSLEGHADFVIGNVLGSNIANIGLALGLPALFYKMDFEYKNVISAFMYNLLACGALYYIILDNQISSSDSQIFLFLFVIYIIASFLRPNITSCGNELANEEDVCLRKAFGRLISGSLILYAGSELFVSNGAAPLVREFGFSEKAVGMTVVAMGTSLPELFVTMTALSRKEVGISLGNIIGSNIFNILFVLGIIGLIGPLEVSDVSFELFFGVGLLFLLAFLSFFYKGLNKLSGFLLVLIYILFLYLQFYG
ncbi:MAG: calcium/sodium antiporter [Candidatus Marinimicrobia bacterium]|jgi:cation:H+ antiporter|nr:calcium/sodium antiporter [Gammaproteobacteria bacterium]MBL6911774.1 calcium/sodium antiporter [Candidatus Neomarinimicrobiota bacterium]MBT3728189.1 calcium/sodium antiporter [Candidatus Neomarinimicrobiota bacterium]MBT3944084.1 calcium/sodium antiporter [Candidatus Neomarinimicrobiota bacterium]MBT4112059.1 calcium/sodium antiporter [Candidatus Neomarinimicrobiota bacterium]